MSNPDLFRPRGEYDYYLFDYCLVYFKKVNGDIYMKRIPFDYDMVLEEFCDNKEFLAKVINGFIDNATRQIGVIREAINDSDAEIVKLEAHSIKGAALNLSANMLANIALELEDIGKSGILKDADEKLRMLSMELNEVRLYNQSLSPEKIN